MKLILNFVHTLLALLLAATLALPAQQPTSQQLQDPANLSGERVSAPNLADDLPINHGAPALQQLLRKLRTRASFMLIVAHPDDEDGGLLTYLSRGQGARVAMLTLTRGEGGQNLMSGDFDDALGLIRTQELLAADRYMAVDQFFGTEVDFGFSKTKEEAFAKWTHDRVLYDAVRAVRLYRPLVIGAVFIGAPSDGHGHHQVSGQIAQEVFNAAGDPNVFPDQIAAGLQPWQPLKVYARVPFARIDAQGMFDYATTQYTPARFTNYVTGKVTTTVPKVNVVIPEGNTDPLLSGLSYFQFAREGLALQKTQIGQSTRLASPGQHDVSYHRYGSHLNQPDGDNSGLEPSVFDGIDTSFAGMATLVPDAPEKFRALLEKVDQQIAEAQSKFDPNHIEAIAPQLRIALGGVDEFIHELEDPNVNDIPPLESYNILHELRIKRVQLNNALVIALGVELKATIKQPGTSTPVSELLTTQRLANFHLDISQRGHSSLKLKEAEVSASTKTSIIFSNKKGTPLQANTALVHSADLRSGLPATRPYFSRPDIEQPVYDISDPSLRNAPATPSPLTATVTLDYDGVPLTLAATAECSDESASHIPRAVVVVPPVSITLAAHAAAVPITRSTFSLSYSATNPEPHFAPEFRLEIPPLWSYVLPPAANPLHVLPLPSHGRVSRETAEIKAIDPSPYRSYPVIVVAALDGHDYTEGFRSVGYPGLPTTNFYTPTTFHVFAVDLQTAPNLNVAYLPGTGDDVPGALEYLGVHPHLITVADLTVESLKPYDAVVLGVRAYEAHSDLAAASPALLAYAQSGGTVIVQYVGRDFPTGSTPYPLSLGDNEKVVEEQAPVRILLPANPLLSWPNQITSSDFHNWVEERGHGFLSSWDKRYTALLETHDAGQQPQAGGLLYTRTGKGVWIYLGLAVYRQLPEGVPGSYRLFANLISASRNLVLQSTPPSAP